MWSGCRPGHRRRRILKTLANTPRPVRCLTVFTDRLAGAGVQVWTANDCLARRNAEWMQPAYRMLGIGAHALGQLSAAAARRAAYGAAVTYAAGDEVGLDYLRDQLALAPG